MKPTTAVFFAVLACIVIICADVSAVEENRCPRGCPRHFLPVCGIQGRQSKQFSNECMWKNHNCEHPDDTYPEMKEGTCDNI